MALLHWAVSEGRYNMVRFLIKCGVNVDYLENDLCPLHIAAHHGHSKVVSELLKGNATVNLPTNGGWTALHMAAAFGHNNVVPELIKGGANVDLFENLGYTPLHLAALNGKSEVIFELLKGNATVDLLTKDDTGRSALHVAADNGHRDAVIELIKGKAKINLLADNDIGKAAIHFAAESDYSDVVLELIKRTANPDMLTNAGWAAIHIAAHNGLLEVISTLLKANADADLRTTNGMSALHIAATKGDSDVVSQLLKLGANRDLLTKLGETALHLAAIMGHCGVIFKLTEYGADINLSSDYGTPLHLAAGMGHVDAVSLLINLGSSINTYNKGRLNTPLMIAASSGFAEITQQLLNAQADVNALSVYNGTALHSAAGLGKNKIVALLLMKNANPNIKDLEGQTALSTAAAQGNAVTVQLILELCHIRRSLLEKENLDFSLFCAVGRKQISTMNILIKYASVTPKTITACLAIPSAKLFRFLLPYYFHEKARQEILEDANASSEDEMVFERKVDYNLEVLERCSKELIPYENKPIFKEAVQHLITIINGQVRHYKTLKKYSTSLNKIVNTIDNDIFSRSKVVQVFENFNERDEKIMTSSRALMKDNLMKEIGKGSFGEVYMLNIFINEESRLVEIQLAIKKVFLKLGRSCNVDDVLEEAKKLKQLSHKNVVKLHGIDFKNWQKPFFVIVMEFCDQDLKRYYIEEGQKYNRNPGYTINTRYYTLSLQISLEIMKQVCSGLAFIHLKKCIHKDLKLANIMMKENVVKIGDFGLSDFFEGEEQRTLRLKGTKVYMAPECFKGIYSPKTDCYVLGLLFLEIWVGKFYYEQSCFDGNKLPGKEVVDEIRAGRRPSFDGPNNPPKPIQKFMSACWSHNSADRPTAVECWKKLSKILKIVNRAVPDIRKIKYA